MIDPTGKRFDDQLIMPPVPQRGDRLTHGYFARLHKAIDTVYRASSLPAQTLESLAIPLRCHNKSGLNIAPLSAVEIYGQITNKAGVYIRTPSAAGLTNVGFTIQGIDNGYSGAVYVGGVHLARHKAGSAKAYYTTARDDTRIQHAEGGALFALTLLEGVGWLTEATGSERYSFVVDRGVRESLLVAYV
ncbi:MAG TPA: hypothetical protein VM238_16445 [Phycisphaerae bacterium]|nr:hypothetical protein [Phycisphaerae bacterium]